MTSAQEPNDSVASVLAREAQRYLAVVEAFRREGCEPHWRPERHAFAQPLERSKRCPS